MNIALIDWNWTGHHPTYFTNLAASFAKAEVNVFPFCPKPAEFNEQIKKCRLKKGQFIKIKTPVKIDAPSYRRIFPPLVRQELSAIWHYTKLRFLIKSVANKKQIKFNLIFFACVYDREFEHFKKVRCIFDIPWGGLYLHARSFRMPNSPIPYTGGMPVPEKIFDSKQLRFVAVLDEKAVSPLKVITKEKPVVVFPDITNTNLARDKCSGLAGKVKRFASGKPILSLTGHLQWTKGIDMFTAAAERPEMEDYCFFLGGEVNWSEISEKDKAFLQRKWEKLPNVFCHLQKLPEQTMNAIYCVSDIIIATYRQFPNSSNALTKAAYFEKPIIVSDGFLMAERVREYKLGEVIQEGNVDALVKTIKRMLVPSYAKNIRLRARWRDYRQEHSLQRLNKTIKEIVGAM